MAPQSDSFTNEKAICIALSHIDQHLGQYTTSKQQRDALTDLAKRHAVRKPLARDPSHPVVFDGERYRALLERIFRNGDNVHSKMLEPGEGKIHTLFTKGSATLSLPYLEKIGFQNESNDVLGTKESTGSVVPRLSRDVASAGESSRRTDKAIAKHAQEAVAMSAEDRAAHSMLGDESNIIVSKQPRKRTLVDEGGVVPGSTNEPKSDTTIVAKKRCTGEGVLDGNIRQNGAQQEQVGPEKLLQHSERLSIVQASANDVGDPSRKRCSSHSVEERALKRQRQDITTAADEASKALMPSNEFVPDPAHSQSPKNGLKRGSLEELAGTSTKRQRQDVAQSPAEVIRPTFKVSLDQSSAPEATFVPRRQWIDCSHRTGPEPVSYQEVKGALHSMHYGTVSVANNYMGGEALNSNPPAAFVINPSPQLEALYRLVLGSGDGSDWKANANKMLARKLPSFTLLAACLGAAVYSRAIAIDVPWHGSKDFALAKEVEDLKHVPVAEVEDMEFQLNHLRRRAAQRKLDDENFIQSVLEPAAKEIADDIMMILQPHMKAQGFTNTEFAPDDFVNLQQRDLQKIISTALKLKAKTDAAWVEYKFEWIKHGAATNKMKMNTLSVGPVEDNLEVLLCVLPVVHAREPERDTWEVFSAARVWTK